MSGTALGMLDGNHTHPALRYAVIDEVRSTDVAFSMIVGAWIILLTEIK